MFDPDTAPPGPPPALVDAQRGSFTRNILITGYWPPTNEMLRSWSRNASQNPSGWQGGNWEGRGYDIHSYFPEFPGGTGINPKGNGDFEVDYQDTATDWARIVEEVRPVAIITFSRANTTVGWELEPAAQRFRLPGETQNIGRTVPTYTGDYQGNRYPSDVPIAAEPLGRVRESTLPVQDIVSAVRAEIPAGQIDPFIANYDPDNLANGYDFGGGFLSGYISYLGLWYQNEHSAPDSVFRTVAAGHIHVGRFMATPIAEQATAITLRTLIDTVNSRIPCPGGLTVASALGAALGTTRRRREPADRRPGD